MASVFHGGCTSSHPQQPCARLPVDVLAGTRRPSFLVFLSVAILKGGRWHLIVVLIYVSLVTSDVETLFTCLSAI